jgi:UDP-N-acetylglucosamine--N-acetylmuramyl-(pentapeptide) pyrophosphoryl-undecaprenol N-acetylglucosamine transferase
MHNELNILKVIISGGGTGGHIFPAIAIANALKILVPNIEILFVGALGRMEMEKVPAAGYPIEGLWISGLQRKLTIDNLSFPFKVISSINKSRKIINKFKPNVVIGVGGYASGPLLYVAANKGIPTLIQEQNSYPGITNKILAKRVNKICVAYQGMEKYFPKDKLILTGNPVRQDILNISTKREDALKFFGMENNKKNLLVIGGSLGARTINQSLKAGIEELSKNNIQVIWQTGKSFIHEANEAVSLYNQSGIKAYDFINRMDYAYAAADVVISRAGASSISELCLVGKPSILVPSPNVAEDHQTKNAIALVNNNAAILVKDSEAKENLIPRAIELLKNEDEQTMLSNNISKMALKDSAKVIANEILMMVN